MNEMKTLYLQRVTLTVEAQGYWYTSGGEKGPFGFYPHLKDGSGYPVYPDTQLHGNLRMAANWLTQMTGLSSNLIVEVFGDEPHGKTRQVPSKLFITDLTLNEISKKKWRPERFEVKPRIAIDDKKRVVQEHMLVFQEMAYLKGLTLTADLYLGYFDDIELLNNARKLVHSSISLISGFGQSRSRGYGRGKIDLKWHDVESYSFEADREQDIPDAIMYTLKNLVHFRNKPVEPGSTQFLSSKRAITDRHLKAWFSKTYFSLFGLWPTLEEMGLINFSHLYPSLEENGNILAGYPPPMTTLKNEDDKIRDTLGLELSYSEIDMEDRENFFKTKTKPLSEDFFVTSNQSPKAFKIDTERRIRNQIEENFATREEGGLFVQEFIKKDTLFAGTIKIDRKTGFEDFLKRAMFILNNIKPVINGAIFHTECKKAIPQAEQGRRPYLVLTPIPCDPMLLNFNSCSYEKQGERMALMDANILTITTTKAFSTTLKRKKRPRITIKPGSIIFNTDSIYEKDGLVSWAGFGCDIENLSKKEVKTMPDEEKKKKREFEISENIRNELKGMTPSQAGFLKEFLNRHRKIDDIKRLAEERKEKYRQKGKKGLEQLYDSIYKHCKDDSGNTMRQYIDFLLDEIFIHQRKKIMPKKEK